MEETVWVIVGIISVLIALGAIIGLVRTNEAEKKLVASGESLDILLGMCNKMCSMPEGTYLPVTARLASGFTLKTTGDRICMLSAGQEQCRRCTCTVQDYLLNLSTAEAKGLFDIHSYECFFLKNEGKLTVNCQG